MKKRTLGLFLLLPCLLSACGLSKDPSSGGGSGGDKPGPDIDIVIDDDDHPVEDADNINSITDLSIDGISYDSSKKTFIITKGGDYSFTGSINGNILVDAGDTDEVKIILNNFTIKSKSDSPIKCNNASSLQISVKLGSKNYIYDSRENKTTDDDTQGAGAITSSCDLKVTGKGSLVIVANYNNGIHCKDTLKMKSESVDDSSIQIKSYNNCLKGNDAIEVENGKIVLISETGNGMVSQNTDISKKGNQRGNVTISGGQIEIYSAKDGIDAAYNAQIHKTEELDSPSVKIYTSKFSSYSGDVNEVSTSKMYIRTSSQQSGSFAIQFRLDDDTYKWARATSKQSQSRSYYYELDKPNNATNYRVFLFPNASTELVEENATAKMASFSTINEYYDTVRISVSGSNITAEGWSNYSSSQGGPGGPGGMQEGNNDKADYSAKGIKAANEINISAGYIFVKAYDDALHAKYGDTLENGATGLGSVNITGGTFSLYASDDGIHADNTLTISGGEIDITNSYEGIEANIINIQGGYTKVYSTDDGLNAAKKANKTPSINVSGGIIDITVYGNDIDGIDSNGNFSQTGGYIITKGGTGRMSTGLDVDGTATIRGGTLICFGAPEKTPSTSGVTSYTLKGNYDSGERTITLPNNQEIKVTLKYTYSVIYVWSDSNTQIKVA